jgi:hypothetical protein
MHLCIGAAKLGTYPTSIKLGEDEDEKLIPLRIISLNKMYCISCSEKSSQDISQ